MTINAALEQFCRDLAAGGVPHPLDQPVTLGLLWYDLAQLAGEDVPPAVAELVDRPLDVAPVDEAPIGAADFFDRPAWVAGQVVRRRLPRA